MQDGAPFLGLAIIAAADEADHVAHGISALAGDGLDLDKIGAHAFGGGVILRCVGGDECDAAEIGADLVVQITRELVMQALRIALVNLDAVPAPAGMMDVVDAFQMGIFHHRDLVEAWHHLAHVLECGFQRSKRLHVGAGAHVFVM